MYKHHHASRQHLTPTPMFSSTHNPHKNVILGNALLVNITTQHGKKNRVSFHTCTQHPRLNWFERDDDLSVGGSAVDLIHRWWIRLTHLKCRRKKLNDQLQIPFIKMCSFHNNSSSNKLQFGHSLQYKWCFGLAKQSSTPTPPPQTMHRLPWCY